MATTSERFKSKKPDPPGSGKNPSGATPRSGRVETRNFRLNVISGAASKLAEQLAGVKLVIPWLLAGMGAPAFVVGLLVPLRQAGALLPQLAVSGQIRAFAVRKWFWVVAAAVQIVALVVVFLGGLGLTPLMGSVLIITMVILYSMCRGIGSIAFQDVTAKTVSKGTRGRLLAYRSAIGGLLTIAAGVLLKAWIESGNQVDGSRAAVLLAALMWLIALISFARIKEPPGGTNAKRSALRELVAGTRYLKNHHWYARYLSARTLLLSVEIAVPFFVIYTQQRFQNSLGLLGTMIVAAGLAQALSSPFWGRMADTSSRSVLAISGLLSAAVTGSALLYGQLPGHWQNPLVMASIFILLGIAEAGVILGRKTYIINATQNDQRANLVAFANSVTGLMMLIFGGIGLIAQYGGISLALSVLTAISLAGAIVSISLPDVDGLPAAKRPQRLHRPGLFAPRLSLR